MVVHTVVSAMQEAEVGGLWSEVGLGKKVGTLSENKQKGLGDVVQVVERWPSKHKALISAMYKNKDQCWKEKKNTCIYK
jgi:hypothetical protein